jgi:Lrp/AsnC family leucine-responsive transcriptional regulator
VTELDDIDLEILRLLQDNGRESWKRLAEQVGLSAPAVMERARKLEQAGFILGYGAIIDPVSAGLSVLAFVAIEGKGPKSHTRLAKKIEDLDEIQECHVTSGQYDYLLKVRCRSSAHLMSVLTSLRANDDALRTHTTVTLATLKESSRVALTSD